MIDETVFWDDAMGFEAYLDRLTWAADEPCRRIQLIVCRKCILKASELSRADLGRLKERLCTAPISTIQFYGGDRRPHPSCMPLAFAITLSGLMESFASNSNLVCARWTEDDSFCTANHDPWLSYELLKMLPRVCKVQFDNAFATEGEVSQMLSALEGNNMLQEFRLCTRPEHFEKVFFKVKLLSSLKCFTLEGNKNINAPRKVMEPVHAYEIAQLLKSSLPITVRLKGLNFCSRDSHHVLCEGLVGAHVDGFELDRCKVLHLGLLAEAVAKSRLKKVTIRVFMQKELNLKSWVKGILCMPCLEVLDLSSTFQLDRSAQEIEAAMFAAAAKCPCLKRLRLPVCSFSVNLDTALAKCVTPSSLIEDISLVCCPASTYTMQLSAFIKAMKLNYTVTSIKFEKNLNLTPVVIRDMQKWLGIICQLNKFGRKYLQDNAADEQQCFHLIEGINNDIDCCFVHQQENPLLSGLIYSAVRKRKR